MKTVVPKVFLVGETRIVPEGLEQFLEHVGAPEWKSDAPSDSELLCEVMGRLCYRSFSPGLNPNVTRVREGNKPYLSNILQVGHGSVLEHASLNFIFADVSRVVTHELVRHRAGVAISQESLRFVRLDNLSAYVPVHIRENEKGMEVFVRTIEHLEELQRELAEIYQINEEKQFDVKKKLT
ncbi:MAG TPA: FAD-dependent thymidylate synthase, partial [Candidatus Hydrogenedentes bacterium]|nr:FAD-dependent thymidylate synthase [Candidatus Hydrogenedentota bacterium]